MSQIKPAYNICTLARSGRYSDRCRAHWRSDIQFGNGAGESDTWSRGPFVSGSQRPSPALREGHINSRGIQLNGSKMLSKYDAAPKTSCETPKLGGDAIWVVSGIKMQIRINTDDSLLLLI